MQGMMNIGQSCCLPSWGAISGIHNSAWQQQQQQQQLQCPVAAEHCSCCHQYSAFPSTSIPAVCIYGGPKVQGPETVSISERSALINKWTVCSMLSHLAQWCRKSAKPQFWCCLSGACTFRQHLHHLAEFTSRGWASFLPFPFWVVTNTTAHLRALFVCCCCFFCKQEVKGKSGLYCGFFNSCQTHQCLLLQPLHSLGCKRCMAAGHESTL